MTTMAYIGFTAIFVVACIAFAANLLLHKWDDGEDDHD